MHDDPRDQFLAQCTRGCTFADVGGLWQTVNEKVSVAHEHGATELTMIDVAPEGDELWNKFDERMRERGIERYSCESRDVCRTTERTYQVVHCSGVLYHHPHPLRMLLALRHMTSEVLVLSSAICREEIQNQAGTFRMPSSGVLFVPALSDGQRAVLAAYWEMRQVEAWGITKVADYDVTDFGPWWFLPTAQALRSMVETCGFAIKDAALMWNDDALTLLLDPQHAR